MSVLFISHDLGLVGELADRIVVMRQGGIREEGQAGQIFTSPKDRYTQALIQCRPTLASQPRRLPVIEDFLDEHQETARISEAAADASYNDDEKTESAASIVPTKAPTESAPQLTHLLMRVRGMRKTFVKREGLLRKHATIAVNDVSFDLKRGRTLGIVGESGSGKTTLAMMILRLLESDGGSVEFDGTDILQLQEKAFHPYRRRMQIVFQNPYASLNPRFTVGQSLLEPLRLHNANMPRKDAVGRAIDWLTRVGLD
jgi:peptide/nickel transport system ATP-binding protein